MVRDFDATVRAGDEADGSELLRFPDLIFDRHYNLLVCEGSSLPLSSTHQ
jgi:hypothetical protein